MRKSKKTISKEEKDFILEKSASLSSLPLELAILDDVDVMKILKISKRTLAQLRADRLIEYHPTGKSKNQSKKLQDAIKEKSKGKRAGKIYYTWRGVWDYVNYNTVVPVYRQTNI